ncbi:MAG TPA: capsular biosynthesis protein, partial [Acidobacteriaceae bacterium]|nr:capsular biosynthesis protein [Acidobacteriaceae bacterium]
MKKSLMVPGLSAICLMGIMGWGQTTAAPATNVPPAAPAVSAKEIAAMETKLADWPQLGRYRAENAALAPAGADEQRV